MSIVGSPNDLKSYARFSQVTAYPFVIREYILLVLHPNLFLPDNRPISINTSRELRVPGQAPPPVSAQSSWVSYYSEPDSPYLVDSSEQRCGPFGYVSRREPKDALSVFSLLVNANSKLQGVANRRHLHPALLQYIGVIKGAIAAIFFVPREVQLSDKISSSTPPVPPLTSAQRSNVPAPPSPARPHGDGDDPHGGDTADPDYQSGGAEEGHSDLDFEDPYQDSGEDGSEEDDSEEDDEPDTINGLTFSEMETVLQRVSDGELSPEERAEAAMLMLGMAGGEFSSIFTPETPSDVENQVRLDVHRRSPR